MQQIAPREWSACVNHVARITTMTKINIEERNKKILDAYRNGTPAKILAREHNLSHGYVNKLAYDSRVKYASDSQIKLSSIIKIACSLLYVPLSELLSSAINDKIVKIRFCVYIVARKNNFSYAAIGRSLKRHHTTVMYGVRSATHLIECDESFEKNDRNTYKCNQ